MGGEGVIGLDVADEGRSVWSELQAEIEQEVIREMVATSNQFAVELAKRAKAVVPYGPNKRYRAKDGLSHPGALQRSIRNDVVLTSRHEHTRVVYADTPYAHYQLMGINRFALSAQVMSARSAGRLGFRRRLLQHSRPDRQANYLYGGGGRTDHKSPLEIMLGMGRFSAMRVVS